VVKKSARNRSQSARPDIQRDLAAHLAASQRALEWAAKCLTYRDAEQTAAAENAEQKARHWLSKAMSLESKARGRSQVADRS
jgi:hypothetical protein